MAVARRGVESTGKVVLSVSILKSILRWLSLWKVHCHCSVHRDWNGWELKELWRCCWSSRQRDERLSFHFCRRHHCPWPLCKLSYNAWPTPVFPKHLKVPLLDWMTELTNQGYEDMVSHRKEVVLLVSEVRQIYKGMVLADGSLTSDTSVGPRMSISVSMTMLVKPGQGVITWTYEVKGVAAAVVEPKR